MKGATDYHESQHFELYKNWMESLWQESFRKELLKHMDFWLKDNESADGAAVKAEAERFLKSLIDVTPRPDTEPEVHKRTKDKYYKPEAKKIFDEFSKQKDRVFQCTDEPAKP